MIMKFLICFLFATLVHCSFLFGQFGHPEVVKVENDGSVSKSLVIDIDNDGFKDIVTSTVSSELIIQLNKGNLFKANNRQRFVPANISSPSNFDFRDLDSDNLPELVAMYPLSTNQSGFILLKNLGDGNFDYPDTLAIQVNETGPYIIGMKLFDINNDGFSDIIYVSNHAIKIFQGTSDPLIFSNGNTVYTNSSLWIDKFDIKDMNNDGSFDIVFNSNEDDMSYSYLDILKHSGNNYIHTNLVTSEFNQEFGNVRYEDINNDNQIDIVLQDDTRSLISGTNTGNFNFTYIATPFQSNAPISFELSDINGDNYPEVVLANYKTLTYFPNNQGIFSNSTPAIGFIFDYVKLHCADFNNDGKKDFLFQNTDIILTLNAGNSFGYTTIITKRLIDSEVSCLDFDHNGTEDLIFTDGWISNEGDRKFGAMNFFNTSSPEYIDISDVGDIDQDGDYDIVGTIDDSLFSFINQGNNYDFTRNPITTYNFFRAVELSDLNSDGHLDISYAVQENGVKLAFRLNQSGSWGNEELISFFNEGLPYEFKFHFTDFNGDSKPDFIIPTYHHLRIFVNNGTNFNETIHYVTGDQYLHPNYNYSFMDFNLDGYTDIAMHTYNVDYAYYLSVLLNDGNMNFTGQHISTPYEAGTLAYQFSDFDSDHDLDLFISDNYWNLSYYENRYNSFDMSSGEDIYLFGAVYKLASGNLFGNENLEIIVSKEGKVVVYENLSIPEIQQPITGNPIPNPATNSITFGIPFNQLQAYTVEVFSNYGTLELLGTIDYENIYLDITSLSSGMYLAKLTNTQTGEVTNISFIKI